MSDSNANMPTPTQEAERIAAELAALGEPELEVGELEALEGRDSAQAESEDAAFVAMLHRFSEPVAEAVELDELAQQRAWAKVQAAGKAKRGGSSRGSGAWIAGVILLAAAAVALLVIVPAQSSVDGQADADAAVALRTQAHAGLEALGVETGPGADAARVRNLLSREGGQGG